jgi:molybdopterin biosynthesis enzyme
MPPSKGTSTGSSSNPPVVLPGCALAAKVMLTNIVAIAIQKLLKKAVFNIKNDFFQTDSDKITNYEITSTFYLMIK